MFFVDDAFHDSPEVQRIPLEHRAAAVGLWTLAGAWSRHGLRDGFVPDFMIPSFGGTTELAEILCDGGKLALWRRRRGGYLFLNWAKWQDTRESVEQKRAAWKERQSRSRSKTPESGEDVTRDSTASSSSSTSSSSTDRQIDPSGGESRPRAPEQDGSISHSVDNSGDAPIDGLNPDYGRIHDRLMEIVPTALRMDATTVAYHFLDRAANPPRMATAYVLSCITRHRNAVENYLHTGRWSE